MNSQTFNQLIKDRETLEYILTRPNLMAMFDRIDIELIEEEIININGEIDLLYKTQSVILN